MFEIPTLINHLDEALVKVEALIYTLQFAAPSKVEAHSKMLVEAETAGAEIRAALKVAQEIETQQKYGNG